MANFTAKFLKKNLFLAFVFVFFISFVGIAALKTAHAEEVTSAPTEEVTTQEETTPVVVTTPVLSTDKDDYHPGESATIFGKLFQPLQNVVLKIFGSDDDNNNYTEQIQNVTTDENGSFSSIYNLDNLYRPFYEMTASAFDGTLLASGWFRDAAVGTYDQCANDDGDGYNGDPGNCDWTNGNLQANNSTYQEGNSTVQRIWIEGFAPNSQHTITIQYGTTKAGKHAYDFLTSWDHSEDWITPADRCDGITGCTGVMSSAFPIPNDTNGSGQFQGTVGTREFSMEGGTITSATLPSLSGSYAGDSETSITITFTTGDANGSMCSKKGQVTSCGVAIWFGAHIAEGAEWFTFNGTTGAGSISGSPYHVALTQLDGSSIGNRDNQMQANSIVVNTTATLTLVKTVNNDNGGTATASSFQGMIDGGNVPWASAQTVSAGTHTASETNLAGYTAGTWGGDCAADGTVTLAAGENKTCTITNDDQPGTLIVKKVLINDNGGTAAVTDFSYKVNGGSDVVFEADGQNDTTVNAGTYSIVENSASGYATTYNNCTNVSIPNGGSATCTITNNDIAPKLTLIKTVTNDNGGTKQISDFVLKIDGNTVTSGAANNVTAGAHTASEISLPGYTASDWGGDCAADGSVTLALGDNKTCTITNDDIAPKLTLTKNVVNDYGVAALASEWTLAADGPTPITGPAGALSITSAEVNSGTYTLSESNGPFGYDDGAWSCSINSGISANAINSQVTLGLADEATCTVTNVAIAPQLTVIKHVINDEDGTLEAGDFTMNVNGTNVSNSSFAGDEAGTVITLDTGEYTVSEVDDFGYTQTLSEDCSGTIGVGETKTCTITNNDVDVLPTVTLNKTVDDNTKPEPGGAFNYTLEITNTSVEPVTITALTDNNTLSEECTDLIGTILAQGASVSCNYSVTHTDAGVFPNTAEVTVQDNEGNSASDNDSESVTVTDVLPTVELVKSVDENTKPEPGGVFNFTLTITNTSVEPVTITALTDSNTLSEQCNDLVGSVLPVGEFGSCSYSVTHTEAGTYPNTASVTVQDDEENPASDSDDESVSVTDVPPTINVEKTASVASVDEPGADVTFTFKVTNTSAFEDVEITSLTDDKFGTLAGDDDCKIGTSLIANASCEFSEVHMISGTGGDTHTNIFTARAKDNENNEVSDNDDAVVLINYIPTLKLIKTVVDNYGGTATAGDWDLTATGGDNGFTDDGATGVTHIVTPGVEYTLSETGPDGYESSDWSCTSGSLQGNTITLAAENDAVCTITNTAIAPKLIVIKHVINNDGDIAQASDFTMHLTGNALSTNDFLGSETGVEVTLNAGAYTVDEVNSAGYTKTLSAECSGTIGVGETKTCTITNDDKPFATRTQGFWQTHTAYATTMIGSWDIGNHQIDTAPELFGGFYSNISKKSTGQKRSAADQARMQMLQQWLAAKLNCAAFGCSVGTQTLLTNAANTWANPSATAGQILSFASQIDAYNNSNDALPIEAQGKATPKNSQAQASLGGIAFWDVLP